MSWQSRITAALSARYEVVDAWDDADETQKQRILEILVAARKCGVIVHARGIVLYWNRVMERMTGIQFAEIHGQHHGMLLVDHTSRECWCHAAESNRCENYIIMMKLPFGPTPCHLSSGPCVWYGQEARIALVEPLLVPERSWSERSALGVDLVMIGEET